MDLQVHKIISLNRPQNPRFYPIVSTGKERDEETGYGYFGARYYWSSVLTGWLSVDPLSDKYPNISPYNYCMWNPVKLVDPNGKDTIYSFALTSMNENQNRKNRLIIEWMRSLGDNPALFIISMHGHPEYMEYVNGNDGSNPDQVQKMTPKMLANMIRMGANLYSDNESKNLQTIFLLYSCTTGKSGNSFGKQLSEELPLSIVFAPIGSLFLYSGQKIDNAEAIYNNKGELFKKGPHQAWCIFMNGKLVKLFLDSAPQAWMNKQGGINKVIKMLNEKYQENYGKETK